MFLRATLILPPWFLFLSFQFYWNWKVILPLLVGIPHSQLTNCVLFCWKVILPLLVGSPSSQLTCCVNMCAVLLITERLFCHCWLRFPIPSSPSVCCSTERLICHCWLGFPIPSSPTVFRSTERLFCHCWLSLPVPSSPVVCCSTDYWKVILPLLVGSPSSQLTCCVNCVLFYWLLKGYFVTVGWDSPFPAHLVCAVLLKGYFATVGWDSPFPAHLLCSVLLKGYFATVDWVSQFPAHLLCAVLLITERLFCHCWLGSPISSSPSVCCSPVAGKVKDPKFQPGETPHSCGEVCRRKGKEGCTHKCVLWVHSVTCTERQSRGALSVSIAAMGKCHRKGQLGCTHSYVL